MKIEVSKMTRLLTRTLKTEFASIFAQEVLKALQSDDFFQCQVNGLRARLRPEDLYRFIGQVSI